MAPITALYAALAAIVILALAANVIIHRGRLRVGLGDGGNPKMLAAIRVHGNAIEYVPIALILMLLYELERGLPILLHVAGVLLLVGRAANAWGLSHSEGTSTGRMVGLVCAFLSILIPAVAILIRTVQIIALQ